MQCWRVGGDCGDFFELSLRAGVPRVRMAIGGDQNVDTTLGDWRENRVADGRWHRLTVRLSNWVRATVARRSRSQSFSDPSPLARRLRCRARAALRPINRLQAMRTRSFAARRPALPRRLRPPVVPPFSRRAAASLHRRQPGGGGCKLVKRPLRRLHPRLGTRRSAFANSRFRASRAKRRRAAWLSALSIRRVRSGGSRRQRATTVRSRRELRRQVERTHLSASANCRWSLSAFNRFSCPHRLHQADGRLCAETSGAKTVDRLACRKRLLGSPTHTLRLADEQSYVAWRSSSSTRSRGSSLNFEFRTRERNTQILAAEFEQRSQLFIFSVSAPFDHRLQTPSLQLENGHAQIRHDDNRYFVVFPELADGRWHSASIDFARGLLVIDHLYEKASKNDRSRSSNRVACSGSSRATSRVVVLSTFTAATRLRVRIRATSSAAFAMWQSAAWRRESPSSRTQNRAALHRTSAPRRRVRQRARVCSIGAALSANVQPAMRATAAPTSAASKALAAAVAASARTARNAAIVACARAAPPGPTASCTRHLPSAPSLFSAILASVGAASAALIEASLRNAINTRARAFASAAHFDGYANRATLRCLLAAVVAGRSLCPVRVRRGRRNARLQPEQRPMSVPRRSSRTPLRSMWRVVD